MPGPQQAPAGIQLDEQDRLLSIAVVEQAALTWVPDPVTGGSFALLQVDARSGTWVVRSRLPAGCVVQTHLHSGPVTALTLEGQWGYPDAGVSCEPGDYLVEDAATIHRLVVSDSDIDVLFTIEGSITYFDTDGLVERIEDWRTVLGDYTGGCREAGVQPRVLGAPDA